MFTRTSRNVTLTKEGKNYFPVVHNSLSAIETATDRLRSDHPSKTLTLQTYSSFANMWLIPRLADFQNSHPNLRIRVNTSYQDTGHRNMDIGIFKGPPFDDRMDYSELFSTELIVICSPERLKRGPPLECPEDLVNHTLLSVPSSENEPEDWLVWLQAANLDVGAMTFGPIFDNYPIVLEAVLNDAGVALARRPFAHRDIESGQLAQPFELAAPEPGSWHFATLKHARRQNHIALFQSWLVAEIEKDRHIGNTPSRSVPPPV